MSRAHQLKIGVSGIRGVVGEFLTPQLASAFAQAFGTYVGPGLVALGRDTRSSGEMIEHAVSCGLLASGCEVVKLGVVPTPTLQVYASQAKVRGGIAVTASHNPPEYNALKLFNREGLFFNHYERAELLDLYHQSDFRQATNQEIRHVSIDTESAVRLHIERVLKHVDAARIRSRRFCRGLRATARACAGSRSSPRRTRIRSSCRASETISARNSALLSPRVWTGRGIGSLRDARRWRRTWLRMRAPGASATAIRRPLLTSALQATWSARSSSS